MRYILILLFFLPLVSKSQIFLETFNEPALSTSGNDDIGGVSWTSTCPSCLDADDWFHIVGGKLDGRDTNGPATFTTSSINTTSCTSISISVDISETGTMEACGSGCNSVDYVSMQYRVDGGSWLDPTNSYFCSGGCAGLNVIQSDDVIGTTTFIADCFASGNTLEIRISVQSWAASEYWEIDNVSVICGGCSILPIELMYFDGENVGNHNLLNWSSASEINNDYYTIEVSTDGYNWNTIKTVNGKGNSTSESHYTVRDYEYTKTQNYYRLSQTDFDGESETFKIISIDNRLESKEIYKVYNIMGQEVNELIDGVLYLKPNEFRIILYTDGSKEKVIR